MQKKIVIIAGLILLTFICLKSCVSKSTIFYGRVVDQLGYPVFRAQVIYATNTGLMGNSKAFRIQTDADGRFTAENNGGWMFEIQRIQHEDYLMDMYSQSGKFDLFIHAEKPVQYGDWGSTSYKKPYTYVMYKKPARSYLNLSLRYSDSKQFDSNKNESYPHYPVIIYDTKFYFKFVIGKSQENGGSCSFYEENKGYYINLEGNDGMYERNPLNCQFRTKRKNSVFIWPATEQEADFAVSLSKIKSTIIGEPKFDETVLHVQTYGNMDLQEISKFVDKNNYKSHGEYQYYLNKRDMRGNPLYPYLAYRSGYKKSIQSILDSFGYWGNRFYFRYGNLYGKMRIEISRKGGFRFISLLNMDGSRDLYSSVQNNENFVEYITRVKRKVGEGSYLRSSYKQQL